MKKKYFLVFSTNFKNENDYIEEWINYHILVGVDHFFLYDQDGGNEASEILRPYEKAGIVTRHPWTHLDGTKYDGPTKLYQTNKNHLAFSHCARNYRSVSDWMMKIDVDEFLYPPLGQDSLIPYLQSLDRTRTRGIRIPRLNFGYNGHINRPESLVIEAYTFREKIPSNHKDLANCLFLSNNRFCNSAHWWHYKLYKPGKLINHTDVNGIRINHYYTKSFEEYRKRQNVSRGRGKDELSFLGRNRDCNLVEDTGMLRYAGDIKRMLEKKRCNISS